MPTYELDLHENLNGEITISDTSGNVLYTVPTPNDYQVPYEALFRQSVNPLLYEPWLNRYKLRARITLLPQDSVEHYLYAQAEQEAYAQQQAVPKLPMMLISGGSEELAISGMELLTNGFCLTVTYPASFSGQVWSVYQQNTPALNADLTNSFNGLESIWSLVFDSLVLTGETATSWTDTQPMGSDTNGNPLHRFYGVGSNEDSDNDELQSGFELFVSHTDEEDGDSDGDGLRDGWEVANGFNPNDGAGTHGSGGDEDDDGLSNADEQELGTDPRVANPVHEVGPEEAVFEYRSIEVTRSKPGFVNFVTDTNGVDRCYLEFESFGEASPPYGWSDYATWSSHRTVDPLSGQTPMPGDTGVYEGEMSGNGWYNSSLNMDYQSTGTWWLASFYEDSQGAVPQSFSWTGTCNSDDPLDCVEANFYGSFFYNLDTYWRTESAVTVLPWYRAGYDLGYSREDYLSNEYTTAMLTNHAWNTLGLAQTLTNLAWGTGWVHQITRTFSWEVLTQETHYASAQTAATYRLTANEAQCEMARVGYRMRIQTTSGVVSRVRVVEWYAAEEESTAMAMMSMSEGSAAPLVARTTRVAVVLGTGNTQYVERSSFVIEPPTNLGVVFVGLLSVDFLDASKNPVSTLKVGKWENAFNAGPTVKDNFIDLDPDRFHVRVNDQSKKGTGKVSVKLSTDSDGTAYDDDATEIELNEEPANSGIFISTNMLMVSDDVDDDFTNPNVVADDTKNDRTHRIALGGKVKVQYPETGTVICEKEATVPPALKTVDVNIIILRDKAAATGGVPVIAVATVSDFWKIAKERYAQVGVDIQLSGPTVIDPPTGVDLADGLLARNPSSSTVLAAEAKSLIAGAGTTNTTDDIHVFYVNDVMAGSAPVGGTAVADFYYDESEDPYTYNVFISDSISSPWGGYAAIHELTHLTTDAGHPTVDTWRLMHGALLTTTGATGSRRLTASEETAIRGNSHVH